MTHKIICAVIGSGRWGINHVTTALQVLGDGLRVVVDADESVREKILAISSGIRFSTEMNAVLDDKEINAVIIATPAHTHYAVAKLCLEHGKNLLIEKPITLQTKEAKDLTRLAESKNLKLMVGHVLLYHPAVKKLKELYTEGKIGKLQYIYSNRLNLGALRSEENILWSFAPHDISLIQYLTEVQPLAIQAVGASFVQAGIEDTTMTILTYPDNVHAHIFVSWLHPFKEQRLVVIGNKGMLVFEDSLPKEKLKFYPKGFQRTEIGILKFEHDYEVIQFEEAQPLVEEQKHFYECIRLDKKPLSDGAHAIEVLSILEKASERMKHGR